MSEQILGTLLQQKNIFPIVVVSLLHFLVPGSPSLTSESLNCPVYPYPHVLLHFKCLFHPHLGLLSDCQARVGAKVLNLPLMVASLLAYLPLPLSIGARDWDVLYPFQDGHIPNNYWTN